MKINSPLERLYNGIIRENPILVLLIGLCPALVAATNCFNGIVLGLITTIVLIFSSFLISLMRKLIPEKIKTPVYIIVVSTFVIVIELLIEAYLPQLKTSLGIYIPLIVTNWIVINRLDYASNNQVLPSLFDGLGMGLGYTVILAILGSIREVVGFGSILGFYILPDFIQPIKFIGIVPGAFIILAVFIAIQNKINIRLGKEDHPSILTLFANDSNKIKTAAHVGITLVFVTTLSSVITYAIREYLLKKFNVIYIQTLCFILIVAFLVQIIEMLLKEYCSKVYNIFGAYLPLMKVNAIVIGLIFINIDKEYTFIQFVVTNLIASVVLAIILIIVASIIEKIEDNDMPTSFKGMPIILITIGLIAIALTGFAGMF